MGRLTTIEIFSLNQKYALKKIPKIKNQIRKKLKLAIKKMENGPYLLSQNADEMIVCGFTDEKTIIIRDLAGYNEGDCINGEVCQKIIIDTNALKEVLDLVLNDSLPSLYTEAKEVQEQGQEPKRNERNAGRKPKFSGEIGERAIKMLDAGMTVRETAQKLGISTTTVQKAKKFYNKIPDE